jgi:hypothetical protein
MHTDYATCLAKNTSYSDTDENPEDTQTVRAHKKELREAREDMDSAGAAFASGTDVMEAIGAFKPAQAAEVSAKEGLRTAVREAARAAAHEAACEYAVACVCNGSDTCTDDFLPHGVGMSSDVASLLCTE